MRNLAYIQTFNRFGSGILFPCKYENKNSCLILTNYHVIRDLKADGEDKKDYIDLEFYDVFGKKVGREFIHAVFVEYGTVYDNENDIAALLIELDDTICISSEFGEEILWEIQEEGSVRSLGYPNLLQDDDINRRLIIEGKIENTYPQMEKMGIYKITDNYHWYEYMSDKELFEGFSGGPVYVQRDHKKSLIGINQSLSNIGDGSNPFKIVYFIRIQQAFEVLREGGIILYEYDNGKIEIEWIKRQTKSTFIQNEKSINILLLGGSGSGKSSFVKEFMLHGKQVDASGDGQTTRMDVTYNLGICCKEPKIKVDFYNKDEFRNRMVDLTCINRITYILQKNYSFPYRNLEEDMFAYLRMFFQPLELLLEILEEKNSDVSKKDPIVDEIHRIVILINECMRKGDNAERTEILDIYQDILNLLKNIINSNYLNISAKQINILFREDWKECYEKNTRKDKTISSLDKKDLNLKDYIKYILSLGNNDIEKYCCITEPEQGIFDVLNVCKGFFDIKEFDFLVKKEEKIKSNFFINASNFDVLEEKDKLNAYYEDLYSYLYQKIQNYLNINNCLEIFLSEMTEKEQEDISLCLKVAKGKSLTGMIKQINITDAISSNYALMIKRCGITKIQLIDTCGLDHIERGTGIKRLLLDRFLKYEERQTKFNAIFYLKKLDAGKPTELEQILPILYNIAPDQPIFNIFTGADIFYGGREEYLTDFSWSKLYEMEKKEERMLIPKSAAYFYDSNTIVKRIPCSKERQDDLHKVIKETLMPFVSNTTERKSKKFVKSNRTYLKKILEAILFDKWNSGYISRENLEKILVNNDFINALDEDILNMFWSASLFDWKYRHHMTVNANIRRILGQVESENYMGYNRTYFDRWDCLLREGYQDAFLSNKSEVVQFLSQNGITKSQSEKMFAKLKGRIIADDIKYGKDYNLEKESKFRKIFRSMYEKEKGCFDHNPYENEKNLDYSEQYEKRAYLEDICEFQKGLKNEKVKKEFRELFKDEILTYAKEENKNYIKNLWQYNLDFKEKVTQITEEIKEFTGTNNNELLKEMFNMFLSFMEK